MNTGLDGISTGKFQRVENFTVKIHSFLRTGDSGERNAVHLK